MGKASRRKHERKQLITLNVPGLAKPVIGRSSVLRGWDPVSGKLSAAILTVIEPFIQDPVPLDRMTDIVGLGCLAWNLSLTEGSERDQEIRKAVRAIESIDPSIFEAALRLLIKRKLELFPDDPRVAAQWKVRETREKFSVTVLAAVTLGG